MWNFDCVKEQIAVIDDRNDRLTYHELSEHGKNLCRAVGKRCLVFQICGNEMGSLIGYTGFLNGRIVCAMLKADLDENMMLGLYRQYCPSFIWTSAKYREYPFYEECEKVYEDHGYILLRTPYKELPALHEELALLLTTSGSTGSARFVRQSYANIRANTDSIVEYLHLDSSERPITTLPMNYTYGISIINSHLDVGATILLTDRSIVQREFWEFFAEQGATSFGGVPYTYEMLKRLHFMQKELPTLRTMTQAGGKLLPELHREYAQYARDNGKEFVVMYGQCEATARMAYLPPEDSIRKAGSMGIAIPGGRLELLDAAGNRIEEPGRTGELVYYGDNVTLGYAESREDLSLGDERGGRLETGDMAYRDEDGYYFIVGRKKRFLKIYGNRVSLDEAERLVKGKFQEIDVACGGVDDRMDIFLTDMQRADEVKRFLAQKLGFHGSVFRTVPLEEIPHNESGKVLYKELEKYSK